MAGRPNSVGWDRWPPRKSLDGTQHLCRWCAKPLSGQQTSWCSRECEREVQVRCNLVDAMKAARSRDKFICQKCGINCAHVDDALRWYEKKWFSKGLRSETQHWPMPSEFRKAIGFTAGHTFEINHIVAIAEGGDPVALENLETLCIPCHRKHTAQLMKRLKSKKSEQPK